MSSKTKQIIERIKTHTSLSNIRWRWGSPAKDCLIATFKSVKLSMWEKTSPKEYTLEVEHKVSGEYKMTRAKSQQDALAQLWGSASVKALPYQDVDDRFLEHFEVEL